MQAPQLKRGLFGYTGPSVRLLLADRDKMFLRAAEQARTAEATVLELQAEVDTLKAAASENEQRVVAAEARATEAAEKASAAQAEAADLRTDRNATREELNRAVAQVEELRAEVQDARLDALEARAEVQGAKAELGLAEERMRVAEHQAARQEPDLAVLRRELGSARRDFLVQNQRARTAETQIEQLTAERDGMREEFEAELGDLAAELQLARAAAASAAVAPPPQEAINTAEELTAMVASPEQARDRVLDTARERAEAELRQAERTRREIRQEVDQLAEWRARLASAALAVRAAIAETKLRANRVGDGVRNAVDPVNDAIAALGDRLAGLSELSRPPAAESDSEPWFPVIKLEEREQVAGEASDAPATWGPSR